MTYTETLQPATHRTHHFDVASVMISGPHTTRKIAEELQQQGLSCNYMYLTVEDEWGNTDITYKRMLPALGQAQVLGHQLVVAAQPEGHKLSVAIKRKTDGPFQMLNVHQLSILLADTLMDQAPENGFSCVKSVVLTDMLDTLILKKGHSCKTGVLAPESIQESIATEVAAGYETTLAITENGVYGCNKGFTFLIEQLLRLQETLAEQQLGLFDHLLALYLRYGYYKEQTLTVNLVDQKQTIYYDNMMDYFRKSKNGQLASYTIREIVDYQKKKIHQSGNRQTAKPR